MMWSVQKIKSEYIKQKKVNSYVKININFYTRANVNTIKISSFNQTILL